MTATQRKRRRGNTAELDAFIGVTGEINVDTGDFNIRVQDGGAGGNKTLMSKDNLASLANALTARANMGVAIGSDVQAWSTLLDQITSIGLIDKKQWPTVASGSADPANDISFLPGKIPAQDGSVVLVLASNIVKQKDVAWAASAGAVPTGGLFPGAVLTDTAHGFLIRKDSDGSIDAGIDDNKDATNIPPGYTAYRRVVSALISGGVILDFTQFGDFFELKAAVSDLVSATGSTAGANLVLSVPTGLTSLFAELNIGCLSTTTVDAWVKSTSYTNALPGTSNRDIFVTTTSQTNNAAKSVPVDASAQVQYRNDVITGGSIVFNTSGWTDPRIE